MKEEKIWWFVKIFNLVEGNTMAWSFKSKGWFYHLFQTLKYIKKNSLYDFEPRGSKILKDGEDDVTDS